MTGVTRGSTGAPVTALRAYRDDGPLARALGRLGAGRVVSAPVLLLLGGLPLGVVLWRAPGISASVLVAVAWFVVLGGMGAARPLGRGLDWSVPVILRVTEYAAIAAIAWRADADLLGWAYALLFATALHQYEVVYRLRHLGRVPPVWTATVGWEGRLLVVAILARADSLGAVLMVAAPALAVVYLAESARTWARAGVEGKGFS